MHVSTHDHFLVRAVRTTPCYPHLCVPLLFSFQNVYFIFRAFFRIYIFHSYNSGGQIIVMYMRTLFFFWSCCSSWLQWLSNTSFIKNHAVLLLTLSMGHILYWHFLWNFSITAQQLMKTFMCVCALDFCILNFKLEIDITRMRSYQIFR